MADFDREAMLEMFIYEMSQLLEQLEQSIIRGESGYSMEEINEIFRIMHTIKGSAAMMMFDSISKTSHSMEDLFYYLREQSPVNVDYSTLTDLVLEGTDFVKVELNKIESGETPDGDGSDIIYRIKEFLKLIKGETSQIETVEKKEEIAIQKLIEYEFEMGHYYKSKVVFEEGCEMENIRSYNIIHNLEGIAQNIFHTPKDIIDELAIEPIRKKGFIFIFSTVENFKKMNEVLLSTIYLKNLELEEISKEQYLEELNIIESNFNIEKNIEDTEISDAEISETQISETEISETEISNTIKPVEKEQSQSIQPKKAAVQHVISVNVSKLDQLLNLMGELVIAEAMVSQNPEIQGLELDSFYKETRQLRKIINDVQDTVMSMRMVPLSTTFFKMHRIVRDMCKNMEKDVLLDIVGEETEVDKNIIEHISDPLMHIIRNSIDHGIEKPEVRIKNGKKEQGVVRLEAKNSGGDVLIIIKDDGAGLNKEKIMQKAQKNGLLKKASSEYTDREIFQFIFLPGFSTNEVVTGYSGRGVGMDVVSNNIEVVGGSVIVDSVEGEGSTFTLKIPLTLAIIEGMTIKMGDAKYTIPIISIKQSFKPIKKDIFVDPSGNEMITVRGKVYNLIKLSEFFGVESNITNVEEGIMIMLENGDQTVCLLADDLIGEQQVVVKTMPKYIKKVRGISGCTLLGNGDISLIIDVAGFFDK